MCAIFGLMSDFRLSQIAPFLEKDARSLRRWCELGHVPGAYRSRGGHWRVSGASVSSILESISPPAFARARKESSYPPEVFAKRSYFRSRGITPRQAWTSVYDKLGPMGTDILQKKARGWVPADLLDLGDSWSSNMEWSTLSSKTERRIAFKKASRDVLGDIERSREGSRHLLQSFMAALSKRQSVTEKDYDIIRKSLEKDVPRFSARLIYEKLGISRRTFYRWFPDWKKRLKGVLGEMVAADMSSKRNGHVQWNESGEILFKRRK